MKSEISRFWKKISIFREVFFINFISFFFSFEEEIFHFSRANAREFFLMFKGNFAFRCTKCFQVLACEGTR